MAKRKKYNKRGNRSITLVTGDIVTGKMKRNWLSTLRKGDGVVNVVTQKGKSLSGMAEKRMRGMYPDLPSDVWHFGGKTLIGRWGPTYIMWPRSWQAKGQKHRHIVIGMAKQLDLVRSSRSRRKNQL